MISLRRRRYARRHSWRWPVGTCSSRHGAISIATDPRSAVSVYVDTVRWRGLGLQRCTDLPRSAMVRAIVVDRNKNSARRSCRGRDADARPTGRQHVFPAGPACSGRKTPSLRLWLRFALSARGSVVQRLSIVHPMSVRHVSTVRSMRVMLESWPVKSYFSHS